MQTKPKEPPRVETVPFSLLFALVDLLVDEVDHQIGGYHQQVDDVCDEHVVDLVADDLRGDAGDVADDDHHDEHQAHALCRTGFDIFDQVDRPRNAEADEHDGFKNFCH